MATRIRAWRLANNVYRPWEPDANGHWQSTELAFAIGMEDGWATIYSRGGRRMLREGEVEAEFARRRQTLAGQQDELTNRDAEIERLRRLLDERQGQA
jgi:hypothetical protein